MEKPKEPTIMDKTIADQIVRNLLGMFCVGHIRIVNVPLLSWPSERDPDRMLSRAFTEAGFPEAVSQGKLPSVPGVRDGQEYLMVTLQRRSI